jgi:CRP-like cAMP-binding protein
MYALKRCNKSASVISDLFEASVPHFDGTIVSYAPRQEVVREGDLTENFFLVTDGLFRAEKFTTDGRRQVFAFHMAGDLCGLEPDGAGLINFSHVRRVQILRPEARARLAAADHDAASIDPYRSRQELESVR